MAAYFYVICIAINGFCIEIKINVIITFDIESITFVTEIQIQPQADGPEARASTSLPQPAIARKERAPDESGTKSLHAMVLEDLDPEEEKLPDVEKPPESCNGSKTDGLLVLEDFDHDNMKADEEPKQGEAQIKNKSDSPKVHTTHAWESVPDQESSPQSGIEDIAHGQG